MTKPQITDPRLRESGENAGTAPGFDLESLNELVVQQVSQKAAGFVAQL